MVNTSYYSRQVNKAWPQVGATDLSIDDCLLCVCACYLLGQAWGHSTAYLTTAVYHARELWPILHIVGYELYACAMYMLHMITNEAWMQNIHKQVCSTFQWILVNQAKINGLVWCIGACTNNSTLATKYIYLCIIHGIVVCIGTLYLECIITWPYGEKQDSLDID